MVFGIQFGKPRLDLFKIIQDLLKILIQKKLNKIIKTHKVLQYNTYQYYAKY